jgi:FkbM family methyltransferase
MLKRLALHIGPIRRLVESRNSLAIALTAAEQRAQAAKSPFFHYCASFDAIEVMMRHAVPDLKPTPGYLTNFLGVKIHPKFFPTILGDRAGEVEGVPIPANWHADIAEWAVALRAIDLSRDSFTMIELGCGWGCWMNNTGVAARRAGRRVHVIGVEGEEGHVAFAEEALATNGFAPDEVTLHRGIAASSNGIALFPRTDRSGEVWGLEPVFGATPEQQAQAVRNGTHDVLPMISLADLTGTFARIDLLHIDIQGGEADLIDGCIDLLKQKVAYILIGTHSKQIEGRLYDTLLGHGWRLEMERAAIFGLADGKPIVSVDGVQGWRNPVLLPVQ